MQINSLNWRFVYSYKEHRRELYCEICLLFLLSDSPSKLDSEVWFAVTGIDIDEQRFPCISRWRNVVGSYPESQRHRQAKPDESFLFAVIFIKMKSLILVWFIRWPSVTVTNRHTTSQTSTPRRITHSWLTGSPSFLNMNKFIPASCVYNGSPSKHSTCT